MSLSHGVIASPVIESNYKEIAARAAELESGGDFETAETAWLCAQREARSPINNTYAGNRAHFCSVARTKPVAPKQVASK